MTDNPEIPAPGKCCSLDRSVLPFHVTWESPVYELSGYSASSRSILPALEEAGVRLRLIPMNHSEGVNHDGHENG